MQPNTSTHGSALRPKARLLRTLGAELISNEIVAIIELVKNSYDADATRILLRFTGPLEPGKGCIEVIDNGHGMGLETVRSIWMEPATASKRGQIRRTERLKRRFLGEKGIGRFASSRLADELEVFSRQQKSETEVHGLFDWTQFDDDEKYLDQVLVLWDEHPPKEIRSGGAIDLLWENESHGAQAIECGTILRMTGLKQKWESRHFDELRRALSRLVSPHRNNLEDGGDPGLEISLSLPPEFPDFSCRVEPPPILKHPHYVVNGSVCPDGSFSISYKILSQGTKKSFIGKFYRVKNSRGGFDLRSGDTNGSNGENKPIETRAIECGPLNIELRVWDRDELGNVIQKTNSTIQDVRRDLDAIAGVNIYRDGFRVLPYGEPQDDWLRLDLRRVQNPTLRISNNQIFGVILISADTNGNLKDQSNREGLDDNQALEDLRDVTTEVLSRLETMRYEARPRVAKGKNRKVTGGLFAGIEDGMKEVGTYVAKRYPQDKQVKDLLGKAEEQFDVRLKEIQTVLSRYQRLATLGQLIDHVLHEGRQPLAAINNEAALGLDDVQRAKGSDGELKTKMSSRFSVIQQQGDILAITYKRMEPFGGRRRGRPLQLYLEEIIRDAFNTFSSEISHLKVRTKISESQTLVRLDPAEIQEVIINLMQNSLYWLEQVNESRREVEVHVERKGPDHVEILFSDSGPGITPDNREQIFEPYFSTKPEGIGLGLSIVGEIIEDYYDGSLELLQNGPLNGANFLITLRKRV